MEPKENKPNQCYRPKLMILHRTWVKVTFAFILGIFVGVMLYGIFGIKPTESGLPEELVRGTMYDSRSYDNMKPADVLYLNGPPVTFACDVKYSTKIVEGRIDVTSDFPVKIFVEFSYNDFRVLNMQNITGSGEAITNYASNFLQIENTGTNKYVFQLYNMNSLPHQIRFRITQNDTQLFSNAVMVNKE